MYIINFLLALIILGTEGTHRESLNHLGNNLQGLLSAATDDDGYYGGITGYEPRTFGFSDSEKYLWSPNVTSQGTWTPWSYCPDGSYIFSVDVYHGHPTSPDLTGMEKLVFHCKNLWNMGLDGSVQVGVSSHSDSPETLTCPSFATGFYLKSGPSKGCGDDEGAVGFQINCAEFDRHYFSVTKSRGYWTGEKKCPRESVLCGVSAQVQGEVDTCGHDATGITNTALACCEIPNPLSICLPTHEWKPLSDCKITKNGRCRGKLLEEYNYSHLLDQEVKRFYNSIGHYAEHSVDDLRDNFLDNYDVKFNSTQIGLVLDDISENFGIKYVWRDCDGGRGLEQLVLKCGVQVEGGFFPFVFYKSKVVRCR